MVIIHAQRKRKPLLPGGKEGNLKVKGRRCILSYAVSDLREGKPLGMVVVSWAQP